MKQDVAIQELVQEELHAREQTVKVLVLEDVAADAELILVELMRGGIVHDSRCALSRSEFFAILSDFEPDLVLSDYRLPDITGGEALEHIKEKFPAVPFILVTGAIGEEAATGIMKNGATDYILKDKLFRLVPAVKRALHESKEAMRRRQAEELLRVQHMQLKRQNQELFDSEQRFRQLAENIHEVFWMTNAEKNQMIYVSAGYERVWGRTCDSLYKTPRAWMDGIHPSDRERVAQAAMTKQVAGEYDEIYRIVRPDGSIRWIHDRAFPVRNEAGTVYRVAGIAEDITERKLAENRAEVKNAVIRVLAESSDLDHATVSILQAIGDCLDWEVGAVWEREKQFNALRCVALWQSDKKASAEFAQETRGRLFFQGQGLPGRIWSLGRPLWIPDVMAESGFAFPRAEVAARCGLHGAFGFPITFAKEVMGVIEFFSRKIQEPDKALLEMLDVLGSQIGQYVARRQAEVEAAKLAHAMESTGEMICITDTEDRFIFVNRAFEKAYGYIAEELIGQTPDILFSPKNPPGLLTEILTATRSGGWRGEVIDRRKDGTDFPIFLSTSEIKDNAGQVIGLMGIAQDITERQRSEAQIRLLAHSVQSTAEMVSITDEQNRLTFVNKAFLSAYGYEERDVLGRTPEFLYSSSNPPDLCHQIHQHTLQGGWAGELLNRTRTGREFPIALSTSPIKSAGGVILGLIGVARDISEQKRAEKQAAAFSALGHRLSSANAAEQAAESIMEIASELFGWDAGYVHLYAGAEDRIVPVLTVDTIDGQRMPVSPTAFTLDPSPLMRSVMKDGARLINRDANSNDAVPMTAFGDRNRPSASMMYVPIRSGGSVLGVLSIQNYTPRAYSPTDLTLLQTLADHCGDALARIEAAEALRKAEAKYRSIFEHATEGIFQTTPDGQYISANPALARMFGYNTPAELISSVTNIERQTFTSPENAAELKRQLATSDSVLDFEAERYRNDGTRFWTRINVRVIRGPSGAVQFYEGTVQDITKRKVAESVLRESERRLRLIAENTEDVIFCFDMNQEPVYVNPAVEALTGYTFADIQTQKFINWIHPHDQQRMMTLWEGLYSGAAYSDVEFRLITKSGETKWCSSSWGPLFDESGRQIGIQGRERDITERKHLERELLESSNNERRRVGHELHDGLGQYLAGVAFRAKALEQMLSADNVQHAPAARELTALVSNAINQTRSIARGLDPIEVETIGLPAALQNLAGETQKFFNLNCVFKCSEGMLPLNPEAGLVFYRVVQECIHNAITHGNAGKVDIDLSLNADDVAVRIKDDGIGFDPESGRQSGMGLRVMRYRSQSIGGRVTIRSRPGEGAEVLCSVPRSVCILNDRD